ncbi:hypothetical protein [Neptunomonas marina]|uniref:Uncharacterized protein n=1 Tax=Neptunomonas marina TaxID=1815562 RepID=A0A437QE87_9GAMM|nr:hypothetical protein [Neptunomonas marina]RVU32703.1 hypothetical protein EOE65_03345 [Neptunomonas marina]
MRQSTVGNPIQAFAVSSIRTNVTTLDLRNVLAIRLIADADYQLDGNTATMPRGVTTFARHVSEITFTAPQVVEVMEY